MSLSLKKRLEKQTHREQQRRLHQTMASKIEAKRGVPNHGGTFTEEECIALRQTIRQLTLSHNQVIQALDGYQKLDVADKALESHYMLRGLIELLTLKGIFTPEEVQTVMTKVQTQDLEWTPKPEPAVAEMGDVLLIKFQLFDGETLVDDQTASPFAYPLGSHVFTCDEALVGMKAGEQRTTTTVMREHFRMPQYAGKELTIVVLCSGVMLKK